MEDLLPSEFYLSQNSPNPFKETTKIKYCLPIKAEVTLTLFNSKREKLKELSHKVQNAGTYQILFDGHDLPDGFFYYQLQATDPELNSRELFICTKKMSHIS